MSQLLFKLVVTQAVCNCFYSPSLKQTTVDVDTVPTAKNSAKYNMLRLNCGGRNIKGTPLSTFLHLPEGDVSFSLMYVCTTSCKKNKSPTSTVTQSPSSKVEFRLVSTTCGLAGVIGSNVTEGALITQNNVQSITT